MQYTHRSFTDHLVFTFFAAAIITLVLLWWAPSAGADVVIDACGQTVPAGETGYLVRDLDCAGSGTEGVVLSHRSRLVMSGHVLSGSGSDAADDPRPLQGVRCRAHTVCSVVGPGTIVGFSDAGIAGTRVRVRDVAIAGNALKGIAAFENVTLRRVVVEDNGALGVHAAGRLRMQDTEIFAHERTDVLEWHSPELRPARGRAHEDGAG